MVFAAAPYKVSRIVPENLGLVIRTGPPPYVKSTFLNVQSSHANPSKGCCPFAMPTPLLTPPVSARTTGANAGLVATNPPLGGSCAETDVWLPESMKNSNILELKDPTINETNATVTLDIHPPLHEQSSACSTWHYHYGKPPDKGEPKNPVRIERL